MTHRPDRKDRVKFDRLLAPQASPEEISSHVLCSAFDRLARDMDRKWGVDRLIGLVSQDTAKKWAAVLSRLNAALNDACDGSDEEARKDAVARVEREVGIACRGWGAMDREAEAAGHKPANPDLWQIEHDGAVYVFVRDPALWPAAQAASPGAQIYTLKEAIVALRGLGRLTHATQSAFPGAKIVERRTERTPLENDLNDHIPF